MGRFQIREPVKVIDEAGGTIIATSGFGPGVRIQNLLDLGIPEGDIILGFWWNVQLPAGTTMTTDLRNLDGDGIFPRTIRHHTSGGSVAVILNQFGDDDDLTAFTALLSSDSCGVGHGISMNPFFGFEKVSKGMSFSVVAVNNLASTDVEIWIQTAGDFD